MAIPAEIPAELVRAATVPDFARPNEAAWPRPEALQVIDALEGSWIAVVGVQGYVPAGDGYVPTDHTWAASRCSGELALEFARDSRAGARAFIQDLPDDAVELVALTFDDQDKAA